MAVCASNDPPLVEEIIRATRRYRRRDRASGKKRNGPLASGLATKLLHHHTDSEVLESDRRAGLGRAVARGIASSRP
jgi:hypothetical protein